MPSSHSEITAYVNEGDVARVARALAELCAGEGMRPAAQPHATYAHRVLEPSDGWTFALLPGAPGWTVILSNPWIALCEPSRTGPSRFVDLCTALGTRGFLVDVVSIGPNGRMLVETDGRGLRRLAGFYCRVEDSALVYHGTPLDEAPGFTGLVSFEVCADLGCAAAFADAPRVLRMDDCRAIAHEVGGDNGRRFWTSGEDFSGAWATIQQALIAGGPLPVQGGLLLDFEAEPPGRPDSVPRRHVSSFDVYGLAREFECDGDLAQAAAGYRRAVDMGNDQAADRLAAMYREGRGVPQDDAEAQALSAHARGLREQQAARRASRAATR